MCQVGTERGYHSNSRFLSSESVAHTTSQEVIESAAINELLGVWMSMHVIATNTVQMSRQLISCDTRTLCIPVSLIRVRLVLKQASGHLAANMWHRTRPSTAIQRSLKRFWSLCQLMPLLSSSWSKPPHLRPPLRSRQATSQHHQAVAYPQSRFLASHSLTLIVRY